MYMLVARSNMHESMCTEKGYSKNRTNKCVCVCVCVRMLCELSMIHRHGDSMQPKCVSIHGHMCVCVCVCLSVCAVCVHWKEVVLLQKELEHSISRSTNVGRVNHKASKNAMFVVKHRWQLLHCV